MTKAAGGYKSPRILAFQTLYHIEKDGAYSNLALKDMLAQSRLEPADRALATSIVYGVVKYRRRLDYIISRFSSVKLKKLSLHVLLILRMGLYQMMFLDRIPESAAVNESVKLAEKYAYRSKGFVNGVLRAAARGRDGIVYPNQTTERLGVLYSYPQELVEMWIRELGEDKCEALLRCMNEPPLLTVRLNTFLAPAEKIYASLQAEGFSVRFSAVEDCAIVSGGNIAASEAYQKGLISPQGEGSLLCVQAMAPQPGMLVLDLCAAPGGKSTYIAQRMQNQGRVLAFDIHAHKVELIKNNAKRMKFDIIEASEHDATQPIDGYENRADCVLVDAPCSGLGMIHKKPDIKWSYSEERIAELSQIQLGLLCTGAAYARPGGVLVYSTCTISERENRMVCEAFLKIHPEFKIEDISGGMPEGVSCVRWDGTGVQLIDDGTGVDGFYICKMRKKNETDGEE